MSRTLWCKVQIAIVLLSAVWLMLSACKDPAASINANADRERNLKTTNSATPRNSYDTVGPIVYVALGDSTGSGVGAIEGGYVARLFKRIKVHRQDSRLVNLCFSGATTADVISEQLEEGVRAAPNLVTLGIGINDIGHEVSVEKFAKNFEQILAELKSRTEAVIVITNIPDISSAPRIPAAIRDEYQQLIIEFNERLDQIAANHGTTVFDIYSYTHEQLPLHPEYFSGDGFHPSDKGYELWAERMWPTVARTIGAEVESTNQLH